MDKSKARWLEDLEPYGSRSVAVRVAGANGAMFIQRRPATFTLRLEHNVVRTAQIIRAAEKEALRRGAELTRLLLEYENDAPYISGWCQQFQTESYRIENHRQAPRNLPTPPGVEVMRLRKHQLQSEATPIGALIEHSVGFEARDPRHRVAAQYAEEMLGYARRGGAYWIARCNDVLCGFGMCMPEKDDLGDNLPPVPT